MKSYIARKINGVLLLDKPIDMSSNQALQCVKRLFCAKKAGHTGSLDVLATGMLPICFGEATKFSQFLLNADKYYRVTAQLGIQTTTGDREGEIIATQSAEFVTDLLLKEILQKFRGEIQQIPSMFSAIKHQGTPLYRLARQGIEIERESRAVKIYELKLLKREKDFIDLEVHCSKGTYVRTLVEDIGKQLGCGAHVTQLRRLRVGAYEESRMVTLEILQKLNEQQKMQELEQYLLPMMTMLKHLPAITLSSLQVRYLQMGRKILLKEPLGFVRLMENAQNFLGVGEVLADGYLVAKRLRVMAD